MQTIEEVITQKMNLLLNEVGPHAAGLFMKRVRARQLIHSRLREQYELVHEVTRRRLGPHYYGLKDWA